MRRRRESAQGVKAEQIVSCWPAENNEQARQGNKNYDGVSVYGGSLVSSRACRDSTPGEVEGRGRQIPHTTLKATREIAFVGLG